MMRTNLLLTAVACLASLTAVSGLAAGGPGGDSADWTRFRGPDGSGTAPGARPPIEWSAEKNIRWKVAIPGEGHASPIVLEDRIYVMTAVKTDRVAGDAGAEAPTGAAEGTPGHGPSAAEPTPPPRRRGERQGRGQRRGGARGMRAAGPSNVYEFRVIALDRATGTTRWSTTVREEVPHEGTHRTGSMAAGSPLTDGKHLYAFFGSRGLYCLDLDGEVKWQTDLGDMTTRNSFGEGASPALYGDTLVVPWDHEKQSFVVALDKRTGSEKWRAERDELTNWTTPVVVEVDGKPQAILAGYKATISYDLATGAEIWRCGGLTMNVIPTPIVRDGVVYVTSGFRGQSIQAIRLAGAAGDITGTDQIIWSHDDGTPYVPSPLLVGKRIYFLQGNTARISCFDAATGKSHYSREMIDNVGNVYASPVAAGGHVYVCGREGDVAVLKDGPTLEVVQMNSMGEGIDATPAIVGNEIYLRGSQHLFCIARTESAAGE